MILGGAQLVTATLWSLPTTAAYRRFTAADADPMSEVIVAVDRAHEDADAGCAVIRWQREQMRRWRTVTSPPARCIGARWSRLPSTAHVDHTSAARTATEPNFLDV